MNLVKVSVFSGGSITIELDKCQDCETKACVSACSIPYMGNIMEVKNNLPNFRVSPEAIKKGACTECLGCELECSLKGKKALKIDLSMPELDRWLEQRKLLGGR